MTGPDTTQPEQEIARNEPLRDEASEAALTRTIIPALIVVAIVGLLLALGTARAGSPIGYDEHPPISPGQVEAEHDRAQTCRKQLGLPTYPTRHHWRVTVGAGYRLWMLELWRGRADRCEAVRGRRQHTDLMVAMRVVFPEWTWRRWTIILGCETGHTFSNAVVGAAGETSGFQIHPDSHPWYDEDRGHRDALYGAQSARRVLHSQGWGAWTCARINGLA